MTLKGLVDGMHKNLLQLRRRKLFHRDLIFYRFFFGNRRFSFLAALPCTACYDTPAMVRGYPCVSMRHQDCELQVSECRKQLQAYQLQRKRRVESAVTIKGLMFEERVTYLLFEEKDVEGWKICK